MPDDIYGPPLPDPDPVPRDRLFGGPIIRAATPKERLERWFTGYRYEDEPSMLSMLAALFPGAAGMAGPSKAILLPNMLPQSQRNFKTAIDYISGRPWTRDIRLAGNPSLNEDILGNMGRLQDELPHLAQEATERWIHPDTAHPSQRSVLRGVIENYIRERANRGRIGNPHAPGNEPYLPMVTRVSPSNYIVWNGHHRLSANSLLGNPTKVLSEDLPTVMQSWQEIYGPDDDSPTYTTLQRLLKRFHEGK